MPPPDLGIRRFQTDAVTIDLIIAGAGVAMTQLLRAIEKRFRARAPKRRRIIPVPPASTRPRGK